jgi:tRNA U54 and U55 pseudouridine synthase Pus10
LILTTSGGTYIKEFINSDFGRTYPHLGELMNPDFPFSCEHVELDVISVGE